MRRLHLIVFIGLWFLALLRLTNALWTLSSEHRRNALTACGASVVALSDIRKGKSQVEVDVCLFNSVCLPPHVTSAPLEVSQLLRLISDDVPRLDLAWAHQCIVQRKRLPLSGDARYAISLSGITGCTCKVYSMKSKCGTKGTEERRFEVGDLVQFSRGSSRFTTMGRIHSIDWFNGNENRLEIQILVRTECSYSLCSRFLFSI